MEPLDQFDKFVADVCLKLDLRMPNGVKVASCFHTGFFLMRTLRPMANSIAKGEESAKNDLKIYIENFCDSYGEVLPMRTSFIQQIS